MCHFYRTCAGIHIQFFCKQICSKFVQVYEAVLQALRELIFSHCCCDVIHYFCFIGIGTVMHGSRMQLLLNSYFSS